MKAYRLKLKMICFIVAMLLVFKSHGQFIEFGGSLGGTTYQGDINHLSSRLSIQGARLLNSIHLGYHFNDFFSLKVRYSHTSISAYDSESIDDWRRSRNLHFKTSIREYALISEIELSDIIKKFRKLQLKPFVSVGICLFNFNPKATYKGEWVDLQPLGTEGQGLPGYEKPYKLQQISIPFGAGLKYYINEKWVFAFEISPRITFTDYLDDVSGKYPDLDLSRNAKGAISSAMSYRSNLLPGFIPPKEPVTGFGRGNSKDNDWYIFNSFTIAYKFDPYTWYKKRKSFRYGRKCSFF